MDMFIKKATETDNKHEFRKKEYHLDVKECSEVGERE